MPDAAVACRSDEDTGTHSPVSAPQCQAPQHPPRPLPCGGPLPPRPPSLSQSHLSLNIVCLNCPHAPPPGHLCYCPHPNAYLTGGRHYPEVPGRNSIFMPGSCHPSHSVCRTTEAETLGSSDASFFWPLVLGAVLPCLCLAGWIMEVRSFTAALHPPHGWGALNGGLAWWVCDSDSSFRLCPCSASWVISQTSVLTLCV